MKTPTTSSRIVMRRAELAGLALNASEVIASENAALADAMLAFLTYELRESVLDRAPCVALLQAGRRHPA